MDKSNDPQYMTKYLETALKLETYLYSARKAKDQTAALHNQAQQEAEQLEQKYTENFFTLAGNDKDEYVKQNRVPAKSVVMPILLCVLFAIVAAGVGVFAYSISKGDISSFLGDLMEFEIIPVGLLILFLCIAVHRAKLKKVRTNEALENEFDRNQEAAYDENDAVWNRKEALDNRVVSLKESYWVLDKQVKDLEASLNTFYSEGVLAEDYRSLECVGTLYGYLYRGRCNTIKGSGGIYDTFETDLKRGEFIRHLTNISAQLGQIQRNQQVLYDALQEGNRLAEMTLNEIKSTRQEVGRKLDAISYEQKRHNAVSEWLSWQNYYNLR